MLNDALVEAGLDVNQEGWTWLEEQCGGVRNDGASDPGAAAGSGDDIFGGASGGGDWTSYTTVHEFGSDVYESGKDALTADGYTDYAIVTFSRSGAEGASPSMDYDGDGNTLTGSTYLELTQEEKDLLAFCKENYAHTVVLVNSAAAMELGFVDSEEYNVDACLWIGHPGEAGVVGVGTILTGRTNPSGRLVDTYAYDVTTNPTYYNTDDNRYANAENQTFYQYEEGIYVGYRYFETADSVGYFDSEEFTGHEFKNGTVTGYEEVVQYPFGYGLSYTTFQYSDLKVSEKQVSFVIRNTGERDGAEVAQLYVSCPEGKVFRPEKELKGFQKVYLKAGESKTVTIPLDDKAFRYWNIKTNQWERETSGYHILVGSSSRDIRLEDTLFVEGTTEHLPYSRSMIESYYTGKIKHVADQEFAALMGGILPEEKKNQELTINDALCQMEEAKSSFARLVFRILTRMKDQSQKKGTPNLNVLFIYNIPFRGIAKMTNGMVSMKMAEGMVTAVNGHFFRGLRKIIKEYFENAKANKKFEKELSELQ